MAKSPKSRTSASCPATISNKSTTSKPTLFRDIGTPVMFHTENSQELQRFLKRAREASCENEKTSEKKPNYLRNLFRRAKKKPAVNCLTEPNRSTTGAKLSGTHDPSNTAGDVLPAKQKHSLVTLPTSKTALIPVTVEQCYGALAEAQEQLLTVQRSSSAVEKSVGVTRDRGQAVASISGRDNAGVPHASEVVVEVNALTSNNTDTTDPSSQAEAPCIADNSLTTDGSFNLEPSVSQVQNFPKLRQWFSAPALTVTRHSRFGSDSTLVDYLPPSPTIPLPSPPDSPITVIYVGDGEIEANQNSRASSPYGRSDLYKVSPYQVFGAWRDSVVGSVEKTKAAQDIEFAERLARAIAEAKAAKDEEWSDRLEKAVAQVEAAKDEQLEIFDRFKDSSHSNAIKDLEEDHKQEVQELEEKHATALEELITKHDEELSELTRKHGLKARKLEMRRAQGVKEVKKLKEDLSEMDAEKMTTEKNLVHLTGQRDALSAALAVIKAPSPPQALIALERSQCNHCRYRHLGELENTTGTADNDSRPMANAGTNAVNETEVPAADNGPRQPHQQGQKVQRPTIPNDLYPRLQLVETENAQLREDLERRHEDVKYAIEKADKLRALLEEDTTKADTYADLLMHKEVIEDLRTRLAESYEVVEWEKLEAQRLRGQIDVVAAAAQSEALERLLAVKAKETAWEQNETLLKNLKGKFGKDEFDQAFWAHHESLAKEKAGLEDDIKGYKQEHRDMMEEAVELKSKISELELKDDQDGFQDLRNQILTLQVENGVLNAELSFQLAEQANQKEGQQIPQSLREIQDRILKEKNKEIALLKARLENHAVEEDGRKGDVRGAEGLETCADTPRSDYGFF